MAHLAARLVLTAIVLLLSCPAFGAVHTVTVPGVVKAGGMNGTNYVSDLVVMNGGSVSTTVTLSFVPSGLPARDYPLDAGASLTVRDVVASAFGAAQGTGAVVLSADQPLVVRGRTYNTASSGTFGVALPIVEESRFLSPGDVAHSLWISQDSQGDRGYRTNIAVVFPDPTGGSATVTLYDAVGTRQGQQEFSLGAAGLKQIPVGDIVAGGLTLGRAEIDVTSGRAAGYAVVVDNVTGDGSLFSFEDLPAGRQNVVVNGVSRAGGALSTFWRTDARLYNPSPRDAVVTVIFHAAGDSNPSPLTSTVTVGAGRILEVVDLLGTLMSLPVGSSGALRFQSETPVAVLCRTSNLDPTGVRSGTFGAQQQAVPLMSYLTSADAGAVVTGVRQNGAFRTNVGFSAGEDGASYTLTLRSPNGGVVGTTTGSLGVFGWTQPNVGSLFPGTSIPDDAELTVKVTAGSVDVYDSSIDAGSGDPVITRIAPLPAEIPSSATIGLEGGSIRSTDGRLTLKVPAGALSANTSLAIANVANGIPGGVGAGYTLSPGNLSLAKSALLVLGYGSSDTEGSAPGALGLAFRNGGDWYVVTGGSVDTRERTLTVPIASTTPAISGRVTTSRTTQADTSPQEWSAYTAFMMHPGKAAVLQGKKIKLEVWVRPNPSSTESRTLGTPRLLPFFAPADWLYSWYANGVLLGSNAEGYLTEIGPDAEYTAPSCNPMGNAVRVSARCINPEDSDARYRDPQSLVWVVPPDWQLVLESGFGNGSDQTLGAWRALSTVSGGFSLDANLSVTDPHLSMGLPATDRVEPPSSFRMGPYTPGKINSVTGSFSSEDGLLHLIVDTTTSTFPLIEMVVGGSGVTLIPAQPGFTRSRTVLAPIASVGVTVEDGFNLAYNLTDNLTVEPILSRCH